MSRLPLGFLTLALAVFPLAPIAPSAADGDLDPTFGVGGRVRFEDDYSSVANALAIQADGKIIAAGSMRGDFLLARYKTDGLLDTGFGSDGLVSTDFGQSDITVALAIQSDGKIVAAGGVVVKDSLFNTSGCDFAIARYNQDGSLDSTFGVSGKVITDFSLCDYANAVAIQSDGKIVVAGVMQQNRLP